MPHAVSPAAPQPAPFDLGAFHRRMTSCRHIELLLGQVADVNYFAKDEHGRFVQADPGFVAMLGATTAEEVLGRTDADFFPPEYSARFVADDRVVMTTGEPLYQQLEPVPRPDRTFEWRSVTKVPLRDVDGRVIGVAGVTCLVHAENTSCHPGIFAILEHIGTHYGETLTMEDFAKLAGLSPRTIERHFDQTFKTSPLRYLNTVRLRAARHLLLTTADTMGEIAESCGFCDQSHMTALFSQNFGTTPRRYRATHQRAR
jgi:PAS domain S-box-containing protein